MEPILSNSFGPIKVLCECMKCHKSKYSGMISHLVKYYQDQTLEF